MIVRAIALKHATSTGSACSRTRPRAGGLKAWIQGNSSSGYTALNTGTDLVAFTSRACRDSQWAKLVWNCASATSTERGWYRVAWQQTCAQTNTWLAAMSVGEN